MLMTQQFVSTARKARFRTTMVALFATVALASAAGASASVRSWTLKGPGQTSITEQGSPWLHYDAVAPTPDAPLTWTATSVAEKAGDFHFFWRYNGVHGSGNPVVFLNAESSQGAVSLLETAAPICCSMDPGKFGYWGAYSFTNVAAGDLLRFTFGGQGTGNEVLLQGSLGLGQYFVMGEVPEPASLALLGLGLAGLAAARGRAKH